MYLGKGRVKKVVHTPTGLTARWRSPRAAPVERFQELIARLESIDDVEAREIAEELVGDDARALRRGARADRPAPSTAAPEVRDGLAQDGVVASPAPDPRPLPGAARRTGARRRSRACGRTWSRTAAASSSSGSRTASPTCACTAAATAAPPRRRRWSSRSGRRSTRPRPTSTGSRSKGSWRRSGRSGRSRSPAQTARPGRARPWVELAGVAGLEIGALTQAQVGVVPLLVANVGGTLLAYRNACAGCGAPLHRAELDGGLLTCAGCRRRFELPLAGRAVGRGSPARAGAAARGRRARQGRGRVIEGGAIRELRRLANRHAWTGEPTSPRLRRRSAATSARRRSRPTTATCSTSRSGGSSARARPAARSSPATGRTGRPARGRSGWRGSSSRTSCGRPSGSRSGSRSSSAAARVGGVVAIYPSPAGTTESELDLGAWEELVAANPCSTGSRPTSRR